jgi:hypothetical protein
MALVSQVQKKVIMSKKDIIKYQILTYCYINKLMLSDSYLECLTLLSIIGPIELSSFCFEASDDYIIFKSEQTVRNCINKCKKNKLVLNNPVNKKLIMINPDLQIQKEGSILLDYKFFAK